MPASKSGRVMVISNTAKCGGVGGTDLDIFIGDRATDWGTPRSFLEWLSERFNWTPDLDAAASPHNAKAELFFTQAENGLESDWFGNVWLNPPYGRAIPEWLEKCAKEIKRDEVQSIMVLIPARVDTKWFHSLVMPAAHIVYLIMGRFNFRFDEAIEGANAPFPSMLVYYRKRMAGTARITTLEVPHEARGFGS